ncbi:MAG: hypothetical protein RJA98_1458 [Pseudomonadota bacterium]|jgi:hypothetical protein
MGRDCRDRTDGPSPVYLAQDAQRPIMWVSGIDPLARYQIQSRFRPVLSGHQAECEMTCIAMQALWAVTRLGVDRVFDENDG